MADPDYLDFLDKRIPELQNQGKKGQSNNDLIKIAQNLRDSAFPGAAARRQADREWGERKRKKSA
mgnify:FL=1